MKKNLFICLTVLLVSYSSLAQQQVTFTQYMFNGMSINPGYIGSHDALSITAMGRWQWVGLEGAPVTQTLAVHSPIPHKRIGLGLQVTRDQVAVTDLTSVMAGYSYKIPIAGGILSMGVQGGFQSYNSNLSSVYTIGNDATFDEDFRSTKPNIGVGLFYYNPVFYAGLSAPQLINNKIESDGNVILTQSRHYFLTGGIVFPISDGVKLKPNILVKAVEGAPLSADYNINVLLKEILWLGISYRPPESINFLIELNVNQRFRVGYAYDYVIDQTLSDVATSSHEILLNYRFKLSKDNVVTPRYF
ncbi:MAG: type IX secretion system membrane protein PorP/SprF [Cyclobacteriaceae bacterium]